MLNINRRISIHLHGYAENADTFHLKKLTVNEGGTGGCLDMLQHGCELGTMRLEAVFSSELHGCFGDCLQALLCAVVGNR